MSWMNPETSAEFPVPANYIFPRESTYTVQGPQNYPPQIETNEAVKH